MSYTDQYDMDFEEHFSYGEASESEECEVDVLDDERDALPASDQDMEVSDIELSPPKPKQGTKSTSTKPKSANLGISRRDLDHSLPPIDNIRDIFSDITTKAINAGLDKVVEGLRDRPLRVATMCSGTESPLLALKLVQQSLENQLGKSILIEHVFSAEIEPYKQAYIQRNFNPPLLFRDITEFVVTDDGEQMEGRTAYGAVAAVPRDIDILVAGSSCVDFSNLNSNKATDLYARQGESADTYEAVRRYTVWASPPIVILENVIDAKAWKGIEQEMQDIGYGTKVVKVDTKNYYLPHTRQRRYMLALNKTIYRSDHELDAWEKHMETFRRRASSPVSAFLLPVDDLRLLALLAREALKAKDSFDQEDRWEACRGRHLNRRLELQLGPRKPITSPLPEHGNRKWLKGRVPRELDVIDICHLVQARHGLDSQHKTRIIDISQNVDRVDNAPLGISGCLTPMGTNYITDWCRPVNGYECLILQGIPVDEVSFTSESDAELKNLAGNAMSSTIVGPALLSALLVGFTQLPAYTPRQHLASTITAPTLCDETWLQPWIPQLKETLGLSFVQLLADAEKSARRCYCEGQTFLSNHDILKCQGCGRTACERCKGSPQHQFSHYLTREERLTPHGFITKWSQQFPLILQLDCELTLFLQQQYAIDEELRQSYPQSVINSFAKPFTFKRLHRKGAWSLCYESPYARLELVLANASEWQLFAKPSSTLPANSKLRKVLTLPVARSFVTDHFLSSEMEWQFFIPSAMKMGLEVIGIGKQVESWRSRIGLETYVDEKVWDKIKVVLDENSTDIAGEYHLVPDCGTACNSLYRRNTSSQGSQKEVFFFLDPNPVGPCTKDSFVFSKDCNRLESGEARDTIAEIQPSWRPWNLKNSQTLSASIAGFTTSDCAELTVVKSDILYHSVPKNVVNQQNLQGFTSCSDFTAVLMAQVLMAQFNAYESVNDKWSIPTSINLDNKIFFNNFGWAFRDAKDLVQYKQWTSFTDNFLLQSCATCAPHPPAMRWMPDSKCRLAMHEDHLEAAKYEASMKSRPQAFAVIALLDDSNKVNLKIGINFRTLAHRAISQIKKTEGVHVLTLEWNLDTCFVEPAALTLPKFTTSLKGNDDSLSHKPALRLRLPLHEQQLRSLTWMEEHERMDGVSFPLQHVEEAVLPSIEWKVEVRATAMTMVKGGVLADQP
jgi:site-specific DNA-cytosine methylase